MGILGGKRLLVTGGTRGIGEAVVRAAIAEGADVAFTYRASDDRARQIAADMGSAHPNARCLAFHCDVADAIAMRDGLKAITQELGGIDILVNNAGIARDATLGRMTKDRWDEVISTNLGGVFNTCQALVLQLVKQRSGCIINLTSISGIYGVSGQTNYSAAKAGIIGFTKALSKEVASFGIRVNAVAPGFIMTDMVSSLNETTLAAVKERIALNRFGRVEDVADVVCFLASEKAAYITGQVIQVDGGLVL